MTLQHALFSCDRYTYKAVFATVKLYFHVDTYKEFDAKSAFLRLAHP